MTAGIREARPTPPHRFPVKSNTGAATFLNLARFFHGLATRLQVFPPTGENKERGGRGKFSASLVTVVVASCIALVRRHVIIPR